jgi:hypothetical protein
VSYCHLVVYILDNDSGKINPLKLSCANCSDLHHRYVVRYIELVTRTIGPLGNS